MRRLFLRTAPVWPVAVILIAVVSIGAKDYWAPVLSLDEQSNLVYGDQVVLGRVPHRDFFATYGPANYWLIGGSFSLFGASAESQRLVGLLYHFGVAVGVYLCSSSRGRRVALAAAVTSVLYLIPVSAVAYAWFGGLTSVLLMLAVLQRARTNAGWALAGLLGVSTCWWRPEMLVLAIVTALPFLLFSKKRFLGFAAGSAAATLPMVWFTIVAGWAWLTNVVARLEVNASYMDPDPYALLGGVVIALVGVGMLACGLRRRDSSCLAVAALAAASFPQLLQRPDLAHLSFVAAAIVPLAVVHFIPVASSVSGGRSALQGSRLLDRQISAWLGTVVVLALVVGGVAMSTRDDEGVVHVRSDDRSILAQAELAPAIRNTVDQLVAASSGGGVFVGAQDMSQPTLTWAMIYHLLPPTASRAYYLEIPPGLDAAQQERLVADIEAADALLLTPFSADERQRLFPKIQRVSQSANVAAEQDFCIVGATAFGEIRSRC